MSAPTATGKHREAQAASNHLGWWSRFGLAIGNPRLQTVALLISSPPILTLYLWRTLVGPILLPGTQPVDFFEDYVPSGALIAAGRDPYSVCAQSCWKGLTDAGSLYPPVDAWLSQPLHLIDHAMLGALALIAAQACVAVFIALTVRSLRIRNWRGIALATLVVVSFPPLIDQVVQRNIEVLILAISGVWLVGWVAGDRWWGGAALGVAIAVKLVLAPLLVLSIWFRRIRCSIAAVLAWMLLWIVGAPQYLFEYFTRVVPAVNTGTGYAMDIAPVGAVARLFHPSSIFGQGSGIDPTVRLIGLAITAAVIVATAIALRAPRPDLAGRSLEAAAAVAALPLIYSVVRPGHLLLLLLPMLVLGTAAVRQGQTWVGLAVAASYVLTGPAYLWYTNLVAAGLRGPWVQPGEEMALAGAVLLWVVALTTVWAPVKSAVSNVAALAPSRAGR